MPDDLDLTDFPRPDFGPVWIPCVLCDDIACPGTCLWAAWQPLMEDEDADLSDQSWLCQAGHFHEDGLHCSTTGEEPPWGCPCGFCQDPDDEAWDDGFESYGGTIAWD